MISIKKIIIIYLFFIGILTLFYYDFFYIPQQEQFINLSSAFLQGKLCFLSPTFDAATKDGHDFWPLGPFPAVLLIPFVFLFNQMKQGYLQFLVNLLSIFLLIRIAQRVTNNLTTSLILSFATIFSTAYLGIALIPWSWYFGQTVGFSLILLALEAYFFNRSWFLIGIYVALAYATRVSLIFTSLFFIFNLFFSQSSNKIKLENIIKMIIPIVISITIIGFYNYLRFNNVFETGYSIAPAGWGWTKQDFQLWDIKYLPTNLYTLFLKMPEAIYMSGIKSKIMQFPYLKVDGSGISIFFTSTIFVWILLSNWSNLMVKIAALTCAVTIFAIGGSFSNGGWQYGYRFAIDFYPFLFIILLHSFKKTVSYKFLIVTIAGFLMNLYFINMIFYPK